MSEFKVLDHYSADVWDDELVSEIIDTFLIEKGVIEVREDLSVALLEGNDIVHRVEDEIPLNYDFCLSSDYRNQAESLVEDFPQRELFGWKMVEGEGTQHSAEGPFRAVIEALSEFPEFLGMLKTTPGRYCTPALCDEDGVSRFWLGLYQPLD